LNLQVNESKVITANVKNTGKVPWRASGEKFPANTGYHLVNLGYRWLDRNETPLPFEGRAVLKQECSFPATAKILDLIVKAPAIPGSYVLLIFMVQEQVTWFQNQGAKP
jgi:hypothetical protein